MRKYVLDFIFDEKTGESRIVIDLQDDSMTALEMNEAIRSGEIRESVIREIAGLFGEEMGRSLREGRTGLVCLDHEPPEPGKDLPGIPISAPTPQKKGISQ